MIRLYLRLMFLPEIHEARGMISEIPDKQSDLGESPAYGQNVGFIEILFGFGSRFSIQR